VTDPKKLQSLNIDWTKRYKGQAKLMLQPKDTDEVAQVLKYCNEKSLAVVP